MAGYWDEWEPGAVDTPPPAKKRRGTIAPPVVAKGYWDDWEPGADLKAQAPEDNGSFTGDMVRSFGQVSSSLGKTAQDLGLNRMGRAMEEYGEEKIAANPSQINSAGDIIDKPGTTVREAIGEVLPQVGNAAAWGLGGRIVGGAIGSLAGPVGTVAGQQIGAVGGAFLGNLAQEYGGIRREQTEQGFDDRGRALVAGAGAAALDTAFGVEGAVTKIIGGGAKNLLTREAGQKLLPHVAKQAARGFGVEAVTEGLQTGAERWGAKKDLLSPEAMDEYAVSAVKGGIGGGVMSGTMAGMAGKRKSTAPREPVYEEETAPPPPRDEMEFDVDTDREVGIGITQPINPYNVGGYITDFEQGGVTDPTSGQRGLFGDARGTEPPIEPAAVSPRQEEAIAAQQPPLADQVNERLGIRGPMTPAQRAEYVRQFQAAAADPSRQYSVDPVDNLEQPLDQGQYMGMLAGQDPNAKGKPAAAAPQQDLQTLLNDAGAHFRVTPTPDKGSQAFDVMGNPVFGENTMRSLLTELAALKQAQPEHTQQIDSALMDAGIIKLKASGVPKAQQIAKVLETKRKNLQLGEATSLPEAATILDTQIGALLNQGKNEADIRLGELGAVYEALTGQTPPSLVKANAKPAPTTAAPGVANDSRTDDARFATGDGLSGRGPDTGGSLAVAGPNPAVPGGAVRADPPRTRSPGPKVPVLGGRTQQLTTPVKPEPKRGKLSLRKQDPFQVEGDANDGLENTLELLDITGNSRGVVTAIRDEVSGKRQDEQQLTKEDGDTIFAERFKDSKDAKGDAALAQAYLLQMRDAPYGTSGEIVASLAEQFGVSEATVRSIGNPNTLVAAGKRLGFTENQVRGLLEVDDNSKRETTLIGQARSRLKRLSKKFNATKIEPWRRALASRMSELQERITKLEDKDAPKSDLNDALTEMGVETAEGESSGFGGLDTDRYWAEETTEAGRAAQRLNTLLTRESKLQDMLDAFMQMDNMEPTIARVQALIDKNRIKITEQMAKAEAEMKAAAKRKSEQVTKAEAKEAKAEAPAPVKVKGKKVKAEPAAKAAPKAAPETILTQAEEAEEAWNSVADAWGQDFPRFSDLSTQEQETFTEFGSDNWSARDIKVFIERNGIEFGKDAAVDPEAPSTYTATDLSAELKGFMRAGTLGRNVIIVDSPRDLDNFTDVVTGLLNDTAFGWTRDGRAILIASRIQRGQGRAKFLHEVGVHVGMQNMLTKGELTRLANQVRRWATGNNTLESRIAKRAVNRVAMADTPDASIEHELIAYFVEEAVGAGVDPAAARGPLAQWMREVWTAFKAALTRLGVNPDKLSAQDMVDMAYGAASLETMDSQDVDANLASRGVVQFGKIPPAQKEAAEQWQEGSALMGKTLKQHAAKLLDQLVFTEDLFRRGANAGLAQAKVLDGIFRKRAAMVGNTEREVTRIERLYDSIQSDAERGTGPASANKHLYDVNRQRKWAYQPKWAAFKVDVDPALARQWKNMSPEAKAWVDAVLKHGSDMLQTKRRTLMEATNAEFDSLIKQARVSKDGDGDAVDVTAAREALLEKAKKVKTVEGLQQIARQMSKLDAKESRGDSADQRVARLKKAKAEQVAMFERLFATNEKLPYSPMRRFGPYVVIARSKTYLAAKTDEAKAKLESDPNHYQVSFTESLFEANKLERELIDQGAYAQVNTREREAARNDMYGGMLQAFNKLRAQVDGEMNNEGKSKEEMAALETTRNLLTDLYLSSLAENSARTAELKRRGVAGELDMLRSFSTQGRADAHFLASVAYNTPTMEAFNAMRKEVRNGQGDEFKKSTMFNEIVARHDQSMKYVDGRGEEIARTVTRGTSVMTLALSPAYYMQNLTQPVMLSLPFMAGKHDYDAAAGALAQAYKDVAAMAEGTGAFGDFDFDKAPADVRKAINELVNRQRIDVGLDTELGRIKLQEDGKVSQVWNKVDDTIRAASQKVEAINRLATAMAAYRLEYARAKGDAATKAAAALEYADEVLYRTHGDYGRFNAPRFFNHPAGKIALQFRKYQLILGSLLIRLVRDSLKGESEEVRSAARRSLTFTIGHALTLTGVVGLPGFTLASFLIGKIVDAFGDEEDEPFNLEMKMRQSLGNDDLARMLMRGVPTAGNVDVSGKIGMGNAFSLFPYTDLKLDKQGATEVGFAALTGASGGLFLKWVDGVDQMTKGNYHRGLEKFLPNGVSSAAAAFREKTEGITRLNGDVLVGKDEISTWESIVRSVGLTTADGSSRRVATDVSFNRKEAFDSRATKIKNEYVKARRDGESTKEAMESWRKLQDARAKAGLKRQPMSSLLRAPMEQKRRERNTINGLQYRQGERRSVEQLTEEEEE